MILTFKKDRVAVMPSVGVLPYTEKNGVPDEMIENVISCSVETVMKEYSILTLQVLIKEHQNESQETNGG